MERLTFEGSFCDIAQCRELPCPYNGACSQRKVWERLKAYEDTGLTPEEVSALIKDWSDLRTTIGECGGIDRLRELAEADKDGRVAVVHGRWGHLGGDEWLCTACGFVITTEGSWDKPTKKYCEDCGAKMDGGNS
jgi:hypothetical protein